MGTLSRPLIMPPVYSLHTDLCATLSAPIFVYRLLTCSASSLRIATAFSLCSLITPSALSCLPFLLLYWGHFPHSISYCFEWTTRPLTLVRLSCQRLTPYLCHEDKLGLPFEHKDNKIKDQPTASRHQKM